jgi:hypothetical protein
MSGIKRIEFIGPSGVGKTTFYNHYLSQRKPESLWFNKEEVIQQYANEIINIQELPFRLQFYIKFGIKRNYYEQWFYRHFIKEYKNQIINENINTYSVLLDILIKDFAENKEIHPFNKLKMFNFYVQRLEDLAIVNYVGNNQKVLFDDGVIHNNSGLSNPLYLEYLKNCDTTILNLILPSGVIYCGLPLEENLKRRQNRIGSGKGTFLEKDLDMVSLKELTIYSSNKASEKIQNIENLGVPVLQLSMNDSIDKMVSEVDNFILNI